jgi:osmotically inducible protein OsmC
MNPLYTAEATATGEGRANGHAETSDGGVKVDLRLPKEMGGQGGGTNPEQLVALGYAACFMGALRVVAGHKKIVLNEPKVTCKATIGKEGDDFALAFEIDVTLPGVPADQAADLVAAAHTVCPYSRAFKNGAPSVAKVAA